MTVGDKLHQTLSSLESAKAQLETFGLETKDKQAQQMYNSCASQLEQVVSQLKGRVNYVEGQEPQYKVRQQAGQAGAQQQQQGQTTMGGGTQYQTTMTTAGGGKKQTNVTRTTNRTT